MLEAVKSLTMPLGVGSALGLSWSVASATLLQAGDPPGVVLSIVPAVSLAAIIGGAISMGMLFNRVRTLERERRELKEEIKEEFANLWNELRDLERRSP